jgi:hypothetical protein
MPVIDMTGLDTQLAPMKAIDEILSDYANGFVSGKEALTLIDIVNYEWKH